MKIALGTIEVDDETRRLIAGYYGHPGLADRRTCRDFIVRNGIEEVDNLALLEERGETE